jgi:hypothetical protein
MKVQETPPDQKRLDLIQAVFVDAAALLDVDPRRDSPQAIMQKVNDAIVDLVFERVERCHVPGPFIQRALRGL